METKKYAFLASLLGGYVVHLTAFANLIPNEDGLSRVYDTQEMIVSGRWFLHYASMPHGFMQMPSFIGFLALCFLGLSAVLIVDLLKINNKYVAGLMGMTLVSFPSLGFVFLYLFTASAYCLGILLAVFSLWCAKKGGKFWGLAVLSLALSMGIYQAFAPFAIGLAVILVIEELFDKDKNMLSVLQFGVKLLGCLAGGAILYYVILHCGLWLTGQELLPYLGMENTGYPFSSLPRLILDCYLQVFRLFFHSGLNNGTNTVPLVLLNFICVGFGLFATFSWAKKQKESWRVVSLVALCGICPLAFGFVQIISPWTSPTPLMQYPYVLCYVLLLFFLEKSNLFSSQKFFHAVPVVFLGICLSGSWLCNLLYTASAQSHRATESYVTRMMSRVESSSGYRSDMPILIIGTDGGLEESIEAFAFIDHYSIPTETLLSLNKHIYYYLNDWLNIPVPEPSEESFIAMAESEAFLSMPCYPDDGSVAIIDDQVVVKVGEGYLPKSDYEIAYENRGKS
ncbi:MAG: glucosyltransferase domain-containing protein [Eubacteriales bacterium]